MESLRFDLHNEIPTHRNNGNGPGRVRYPGVEPANTLANGMSRPGMQRGGAAARVAQDKGGGIRIKPEPKLPPLAARPRPFRTLRLLALPCSHP